MSERFECEHNWIIDNNKRKTNESLIVYDEEWNTLDDICELLNQQSERIAELEEQLKNAIIPKFKVGQDVFVIYEGIVKITTINSITIFEGNEFSYYCKYIDGERVYLELEEQDLFSTKEEAQAKLKELGEKK